VSDKLRLLSLFAGIGGFELGLERSGGFQTVAQCEIDPYCNKVLAKHWPEVKRYGDIRELTADRLAADGITVDAICGGFPCQDISIAGKQAGIEGERSGLWSEYARLIDELRPRVVFVENVAALLGRGLDRVLGDLAALGYDAVWDCIPASAVGAPHQRDRLWLVAYAEGQRIRPRLCDTEQKSGRRNFVSNGCSDVADAASIGQQGQGQPCERRNQTANNQGKADNAFSVCVGSQWSLEPDVGRVANGVSFRVDKLKALGNAVVPQIPELLGRAYLQAMETTYV
jgi:DNA (cytosine-5)-methyltransferase 1